LRRIDELLAEARGRGAPVLVARALLARAQAGLAAGALDEAEDDLAQARRALPPESWHPGPRASLVAAEIAVQLERDRVDLAEEAVARAPEPIGSSLSSAHLRHATGRLLFAAGRADEALSRFRECGRQLSAHGWENPELLPWRSAAAACLAARGSDEAAARLMAEEIALAARWGTPAATGGAELRAARAALGRPAAVVHLERAVSLLCRGSAYLRQVTALLELATVRVQDGDSEAAGSLVAKAGLLIARHGWTHLVPRLRELAKELEGPAGAVPELSKSQRQVAELAALGVSNAGIAARLAVTKRTVELHLTQVYRKLGIGGRGQLSGSLYPRGTDAGGSAHSRTGTDAFGATAAEA
jgi:DNA-binding NarL/FixJ family response regulator